MQNPNGFNTVFSISKWTNEEAIGQKVLLPKLQRGFVWKPEQITNLWDSILRGFPIGCFLVAINEQTQTKDLLDGQQRSTSIPSGFYNQFNDENNGVFSLKRFPGVWIDIHPKEKPFDNKFSVHVVTQSHPWGLRARNQSQTLSLSERRKALDYYSSLQSFTNYLEIQPKHLVPRDNVCPVPLSFLLSLSDEDLSNFKVILLSKLNSIRVSTANSENINYEEFLKKKIFKYYIMR